MKTINEVKSFIDQFIINEYEMEIYCFDLDSNAVIDKAYELFDKYILPSAERSFSSLTASRKHEGENAKDSYVNDILRKRKVYVIEEYKNPTYNTTLQKNAFSKNLFCCYMSGNHEEANSRYIQKFNVTEIDNQLKIIATEINTVREGWKEFNQFPSILHIGEFVYAIKYETPVLEKDLKHFNSI